MKKMGNQVVSDLVYKPEAAETGDEEGETESRGVNTSLAPKVTKETNTTYMKSPTPNAVASGSGLASKPFATGNGYFNTSTPKGSTTNAGFKGVSNGNPYG